MKDLKSFESFSDDARVWLYQSDRPLDQNEIAQIKEDLSGFTNEWAAHGNKLIAKADVINPYFISFVVQDNETLPSGCSIDSSVNFIKNIERKYKVDFFNRLNVYVQKDQQIEKKHFSDLANMDPTIFVFDALVDRLGIVRNNWPLALEESNYAKLALG
jgi:hypothetical protein